LVEESNFCFSLYSNPSLRVAYIDEVEERESGIVQKVYYSVLIKAVDNRDQVNAY
jgi:callose synthase